MVRYTHITDNQPSGNSMDGSYDLRAAKFQLPSGSVVVSPDFEGQMMFIPTSGVIAVASGTAGDWITFSLS